VTRPSWQRLGAPRAPFAVQILGFEARAQRGNAAVHLQPAAGGILQHTL
jgi:hypothetical protein